MDTPPRQAIVVALLVLIGLAVLAMRVVLARGKSIAESLLGVVAGAAGAIILGGIAFLGDGPPGWASGIISTPEAWTATCAAAGGMFGDRVTIGLMKEANQFSSDPRAWAARWLPWLNKARSDDAKR